MSNYYLYLITDNCENPIISAKGIEDSYINSIRYQDVYVWYSIVGKDTVSRNLENFKIHNQAALKAMETGTVLPFQFGTILKNEEDIYSLVKELNEKIDENFSRLSGKIEMGIKVFGEVPEESLNYRESSHVMERLSTVKSKAESVNYLIDRMKNTKKERVREQFISSLSNELFIPLNSMVIDSSVVFGKKDKMLINAAFLIAKTDLILFREKVEDIKNRHLKYSFLYSGPWPPYNFVNIVKKGEN